MDVRPESFTFDGFVRAEAHFERIGASSVCSLHLESTMCCCATAADGAYYLQVLMWNQLDGQKQVYWRRASM